MGEIATNIGTKTGSASSAQAPPHNIAGLIRWQSKDFGITAVVAAGKCDGTPASCLRLSFVLEQFECHVNRFLCTRLTCVSAFSVFSNFATEPTYSRNAYQYTTSRACKSVKKGPSGRRLLVVQSSCTNTKRTRRTRACTRAVLRKYESVHQDRRQRHIQLIQWRAPP